MPDTHPCPICDTELSADRLIVHMDVDHSHSQIVDQLITTDRRQRTQTVTISNMQQDTITQNRYVESQQATLNTLRLAHEEATRTIKRLLADSVTATDARSMAENEAAHLHEALQRMTAERDQALDEIGRQATRLKEVEHWRGVERERVAECRKAIRDLAAQNQKLSTAYGERTRERDEAQKAASTLRRQLADLAVSPDDDDDDPLLVCPICEAAGKPCHLIDQDGLTTHLFNEHGNPYAGNRATLAGALAAMIDRNTTNERRVVKLSGLVTEYRRNLEVLNEAYHDRASAAQTAERDLTYARKQLAQVLELVAGARLAINKAMAVGEVDAAHLAGLNGYDRAPTPVGPWADDPALYNSVGDMADYVTGYRNAQKIGVAVAPQNAAPAEVPPGWIVQDDGQLVPHVVVSFIIEMAPGVLYPPATGRHDTDNPLSAVTCPNCRGREFRFCIGEQEHGYLCCAECSTEIATTRPRQFV